jgi:hypothetical protein
VVAAPLPVEKLTERADLVVFAKVIEKRPARAVIAIRKIVKGRLHGHQGWLSRLGLRRTAVVQYEADSPVFVLGAWSNERAFTPGNRILAYLYWDDRIDCYNTVWWNGVDVLK